MAEEKAALTIELVGRISSGNAPEVEEQVMAQIGETTGVPIILDAEKLEYISSAGLRILLRVRKMTSDMKIINVNSEVYEILETTGFTEMLDVEKAYRTVSIEGCEVIGRGANGTIYRLDQENVVKAYNNPEALEDIKHEREVARLALVLGIPTAISYDVVKVGDSYGSVFELLNAKSFAQIIAKEPEKLDWCVDEYVKMLKLIHSTLVPEGKLPDIRDKGVFWAERVHDFLPEELGDKLLSMVKEFPKDNHMIHGDYHAGNLELQKDEVLLIDMDTLAIGDPIFEWGFIYNAFVGYSEYDSKEIEEFMGFDAETGLSFWKKALSAYLKTTDPAVIEKVEAKARIIGYIRMMSRSIRLNRHVEGESQKEFELWRSNLIQMLEKVDSLMFSDCEIKVDAEIANLDQVLDFIEEKLDGTGCTMKDLMQIKVAAEEIFTNIANYAYGPNKGFAKVKVEVDDDSRYAVLTFVDAGIAYDPLKKGDPDTTLSAEEREIGGLGIFLTKKFMDEVTYEYSEGHNILKLKRFFNRA